MQQTLLPDTVRVTKRGLSPTEGRQVDTGSSLITSRGGGVHADPHQPEAANAAVSGELQGERVINVVDLETGEVREVREQARPGDAVPQETQETDVFAGMAANQDLSLSQRIRANAARGARAGVRGAAAAGRGVAAAPGQARELAANTLVAGAGALTDYQAGVDQDAQDRLQKAKEAEEALKLLEAEKKRRAALPPSARTAESLASLADRIRGAKGRKDAAQAEESQETRSGPGGEATTPAARTSFAQQAGRFLGGAAAAAPRGGGPPKRKGSQKGRPKGSKSRKNQEMSIVIRYERLDDPTGRAATSYPGNDDLVRKLFGGR